MSVTNGAHVEPQPRKPGKAPARTLVTATAMGEHLAVSRVYISELARDGVIERLPDGCFDLDATRLRYLKWLRDPARRSARSEAVSEFQRMKTRALMLRIAEQEGRLMETVDALEWIEALVGLFRTGLGSLPAQIAGRDLQERRRIERFTEAIMHEIADEADKRAAQAAELPMTATKRGRR